MVHGPWSNNFLHSSLKFPKVEPKRNSQWGESTDHDDGPEIQMIDIYYRMAIRGSCLNGRYFPILLEE